MWHPRLTGGEDDSAVTYPFPVDEARRGAGSGFWSRRAEPRRPLRRHPAEHAIDRLQRTLDQLADQVDELAPLRFGDFAGPGDETPPPHAA